MQSYDVVYSAQMFAIDCSFPDGDAYVRSWVKQRWAHPFVILLSLHKTRSGNSRNIY